MKKQENILIVSVGLFLFSLIYLFEKFGEIPAISIPFICFIFVSIMFIIYRYFFLRKKENQIEEVIQNGEKNREDT